MRKLKTTLKELTKRFTASERIDEKYDERAYYAKGKKLKEKKKIQCYKCKKYGHYQRNCPKNGNDNEKHQHENTSMKTPEWKETKLSVGTLQETLYLMIH